MSRTIFNTLARSLSLAAIGYMLLSPRTFIRDSLKTSVLEKDVKILVDFIKQKGKHTPKHYYAGIGGRTMAAPDRYELAMVTSDGNRWCLTLNTDSEDYTRDLTASNVELFSPNKCTPKPNLPGNKISFTDTYWDGRNLKSSIYSGNVTKEDIPHIYQELTDIAKRSE